MKFNIIENSMDSLNEALKYYFRVNDDSCENQSAYKFCILLLYHSIELLIKELLYREHECLLYESIDDFGRKDKQTVGFKKALMRAKGICKVDFMFYEDVMINLANHRNTIQHLKCDVPDEVSKEIVLSSLSAVEFIINDILCVKFEDFSSVLDMDSIHLVHKDESARKIRILDIKRRFQAQSIEPFSIECGNGSKFHVPCPMCGQELIERVGSTLECKYCSSKYKSHNDMYNDDFLSLIECAALRFIGKRKAVLVDVLECNECENDTLVFNTNDSRWICLCCGNTIDSIYCDDCECNIPNSPEYYKLATSYTDCDDYQFLCRSCGKKLFESEYGSEYNIE